MNHDINKTNAQFYHNCSNFILAKHCLSFNDVQFKTLLIAYVIEMILNN